MVKKQSIVIAIGVLLILATAVLGFWYYKTMPEPPSPQSSALLPKLRKNTLNVKKGESFTIALDSNPTTGYEWETNYDSSRIRFDNKEYKPDFREIVGSGGKETFHFTALESGRTSINFNYIRPWEKDKAPEKTVDYDIIIK